MKYIPMKKLTLILLSFLSLTALSTMAQTDSVKTRQLIEAQNYLFTATNAMPLSSTDINRIMSRIPGNTGSNINLTGGQYDLQITKDSVVAYLPYYGRSFSPSMNPDDAGTKFKSKNFKYTSIRKKKNWIITIDPKDVKDSQRMTLSISQNGYATLTVNNSNRQSISYNGYLSEIKPKK